MFDTIPVIEWEGERLEVAAFEEGEIVCVPLGTRIVRLEYTEPAATEEPAQP